MFDPFSWILGFTLTHFANRTILWFNSDALIRTLNEQAEDWAKNLPSEFKDLSPNAIIDTIFTEDSLPYDSVGPKRAALRNVLEKTQIPNKTQWSEALLERWIEVKTGLKDKAQKFFPSGSNTDKEYY
jgi:hypothetical protein